MTRAVSELTSDPTSGAPALLPLHEASKTSSMTMPAPAIPLPKRGPKRQIWSRRKKLSYYLGQNRTLASMTASVLLHLIVGIAFLVDWSFRKSDDASPPAAIIVELSVLPASPPVPASEIPPGPQQVEAAPKPKPIEKMKFDPPPQVDPSLRPDFALPMKQEVKPQDSPQVAKEARQTTAPPSTLAPPKDKMQAPMEGSNSAPPSDAQQGWLAKILAKLVRNKRYPAQAQSSGQEGTVFVRLVIDERGRLISAALKKYGNFVALDNETLALVKRSSPYPAPPAGSLIAGRVAVTVPVEFYIKKR